MALIFNSYVGAAAIAEYDNQTLEIVRRELLSSPACSVCLVP